MPTDKSPRVSIITPVYNAERFVERTIRSTLAQSFEDWEQIVVDDGSTDATAEIVRTFHDPRIRYIRLPHRGLASLGETYNAALRTARGELIGILEGDDVWPHDKLELQVPSFDASDVMLSWGRAIVIDEHDRVVRRWQCPRIARRDRSAAELFRLLARWNVFPALTVMIRRRALEQIGGFRQLSSKLLVDWPTWLTLAANVSGTAKYIDRDLGLYRVHGGNTGLVHNARLRHEHQQLLDAIIRATGAERLRELGWTPEHERVARASASLTQGIAYLQDKEREAARAAFSAAMRQTRSAREYVTALLGYGSAVLGVDAVAQAQKLRTSAATFAMRVSARAQNRTL